MGSYISGASKIVPSSTVNVIHWNGSVHDLPKGGTIMAAELMMDNPQHFVCHAHGLHIGRRINPLRADELLELGHLYFLVPMPKLHSMLSETDMAALELKANSAVKAKNRGSSRARARARARARVLPLSGDLMRPLSPETKTDIALLLEEEEEDEQISGAQGEEQLPGPKLNLEDDPELLMALAQLRLKAGKSWKPKLDTIEEFRPKLRDLLQWNVEQHENY